MCLGATAGAAITSFCVPAAGTADQCPADAAVKSSLEQAIADASDLNTTTIYLTPGTHTAINRFDLGDKPIRLIGVGQTRPTITAPANNGSAVISTINSRAKFEHLAIAIPASTGMTGLQAANGGQLISDVTVSGPHATASTGIAIGDSNPALDAVSIALDGTAGDSTALRVANSTTPRLDRVHVSESARGIVLEHAINASIRRSNLSSPAPLTSTDSEASISSSLIAIPLDASSTATAVVAESSTRVNGTLSVFNCTIVHPGAAGGSGVRASASGVEASQNVLVDSSIIHGFGTHAAYAAGSAGNPATITLRYAYFDGVAAANATGTLVEGPGTHPATFNYGFVDAAVGNYRPRLDSPLVDAGNPVADDFNQADSGSDLDGLSRTVSRGAGRVRDVGAYEVQNHAPVPVIKIVTAVPATTERTEFSAAESSDADGDPLTFDWSFDGMPATSGAVVKKQFLTPGPHTIRLTATDHTGSSSSVSKQFNVELGYLRLQIPSQSARISRKGTFRVRLSCPVEAASDCTGRLVLRSTDRVDAKRYTKRPGWSSAATHIKAVDDIFRIGPGETRAVTVRTFKTFQNVLAVKKVFRLSGGLTQGTTTNARLTSNRATFTIRAPKSKRRR